MTVNDVIARAQELKPDVYTEEQMTAWLSDLDGRLALELGQETPVGYTYPESGDTALLAASPFDRMYALYLVAMTDFHNREMDAYANDMQMFNAALDDFRCWYRRRHRPAAGKGWTV
jgi:hypothetical protein